jgi:PAS domain S-box-containing protein
VRSAIPEAHRTAAETNAEPLRVLLVEDNEDDTFLLSRYFERAGMRAQLRRVETAEAMLAELVRRDIHWDVVLADYNLPTFSAPAALRVVKDLGLDLPFIMMSGAVSEETAVEAMRSGAHDYISKQNLARLVPAIERELREARARRVKRDTEEALRASEERFRRLVKAMPLGLVVLELQSAASGAGGILAQPHGTVRYANISIEQLLGYSEEALRSGEVSFLSLFEAGSSAAMLDRLRGAVGNTGRLRPFEALCRAHDGTVVPVLAAFAPLAQEDTATQSPSEQVAVFFVDLTDQKRGEEVLRRTEKLAATGRLAASIAHEINNPLEAVTNCLFLIGTEPLNDRAQQFLGMAQRELDRVTHITTQTLRFYRQSTRPVDSDINDLADSVIALFEPRMRGFSIQIDRRYASLPPISAYEGEIRQVLANLVGNAVDAMQRDGGRLLLRTARGTHPRSGAEGIYVTVADTGAGMDAATRTRIFEPFFSTKGARGTGLGLWVSQNILEKHGGYARVRSRIGNGHGASSGTVFRVFLPLEPVRRDSAVSIP